MCAKRHLWLGSGVWGLGSGVWGLGSGVWGLGSGVCCFLGFRCLLRLRFSGRFRTCRTHVMGGGGGGVFSFIRLGFLVVQMKTTGVI